MADTSIFILVTTKSVPRPAGNIRPGQVICARPIRADGSVPFGDWNPAGGERASFFIIRVDEVPEEKAPHICDRLSRHNNVSGTRKHLDITAGANTKAEFIAMVKAKWPAAVPMFAAFFNDVVPQHDDDIPSLTLSQFRHLVWNRRDQRKATEDELDQPVPKTEQV